MASLDCGADGNHWVDYALRCLPEDVWEQHGDRLAFVATTESDGRRLTKHFVEGKHVIVLSERLIPHERGINEENQLVRYLSFTVLHEVAHAICDHKPPSQISPEENQKQEDEANGLAFEWFNGYLKTKASNGLALFTPEELGRIQQEMQQRMLTALGRN